MKKIKIYLFLILATLILNSCGSVQNAMDPQRKNNTDEFLVEKKSPLVMPPNYKELPLPTKQNSKNNLEEENNLKKLIVNNQTSSSELSSDSEESVGSFEKSLIEKIKNN